MAQPTQSVACIGECMVEVSGIDLATGQARIGFAGDTLNTAVYLSRLGVPVSYVTRLGEDRFSAAMLRMFAAEGLDCALVGRHETRLPGLYAVELDATGDRSFRYWREASAARTLFSGGVPGLEDLGRFGTIYLSGITLAILPPEVRQALIEALAFRKAQGATIVFDSNYRPRLWPDADTARAACDAMWRASTIALPSVDDEALLRPGLEADGVLDHLWSLGLREIVLKRGASGPVLRTATGTQALDLDRAASVIDTTGAGDSFNAGYLAARLRGEGCEAAARMGHRLAACVIGHAGAIIPRGAMPA